MAVLIAPDLCLGRHVHELGLDIEQRALLHHPARDEGIHVQGEAYGAWVDRHPLVREHRAPGNHAQLRQLREAVDDALGDAVGQVIRLGLAARVHEREHGERAHPGPSPRDGGRRSRRVRQQGPQRRRELARGREPLGTVFLEAVRHHVREPRRDLQSEQQQVGSGIIEHRGQRIGGRGTYKGPFAREHLERRAAEREQVGRRIRGFTADLLRRHVADRAEHAAGLRRDKRARRRNSGHGVLCARQAEVEDLGVQIAGDEDIVRFQIAVDDTFCVRGGETVGHVRHQLDRVAPGQWAARQAGAQVLAFQQLDHRDRLAIDERELVNGHDVRVRNRGDRSCLVLEALPHLHIVGEMVGQHLERDVAAQPRVAGAIDLTHATGADGREHFELRETCTWGQTQRGSCADRQPFYRPGFEPPTGRGRPPYWRIAGPRIYKYGPSSPARSRRGTTHGDEAPSHPA